MIFWQNPRDNVGKIVFQNFCQADFIIGQFVGFSCKKIRQTVQSDKH